MWITQLPGDVDYARTGGPTCEHPGLGERSGISADEEAIYCLSFPTQVTSATVETLGPSRVGSGSEGTCSHHDFGVASQHFCLNLNPGHVRRCVPGVRHWQCFLVA